GIPILLELCKSGSLSAQSHAVGALRNISVVEDARSALAEEGAVPLLMRLLVIGSASTLRKSAKCIAILASSGEYFRSLVLQEKGLEKLLQLCLECPTSDTLEHVLRAIHSLSSSSDSSLHILSRSTIFTAHLADLIKHGNIRLQHIAASLLCRLSLADGDKILISGCMTPLVKLMASEKPDGIREVATEALLSLLSAKPNRKTLAGDEKVLMRLDQMLDMNNDIVPKRLPVMVVAGIMAGGSKTCRKILVDAGIHEHLQRLTLVDVPGADKALQRLSMKKKKLTGLLTKAW
ncbi:hypothetical protein M569_13889, partial [Genlisea aurea]